MNLEQLKVYLLSALAALIVLTVHEFCHGYAAYKMGDNTAKSLGRLTFNPLSHLDLVGTLCMIFFHFGWAKPVPVNPRNFKDPKKGFAITALAGPLSNLILGFLSAGLYLLLYASLSGVKFESEFLFNLASNVLLFVYLFFTINIGLGIFNLLPIPPFDGSRILHVVLPPKIYFGIMRYEQKIYFGVLAWLLLGDIACDGLRSLPLVQSLPWLYSAAGIFSLSDIIGAVIDFVRGLILDFWQLIPYLKV